MKLNYVILKSLQLIHNYDLHTRLYIVCKAKTFLSLK